ncbi:MAG: ECF transporter S component [Clostridia bacterium]|nr:ECF transporter S component [Clostridia bacterium]
MKSSFNIRKLVGLGLFTAIVIVLQLLGSFIKFGPFSVSLVLIPIVVGAALYGWIGGAWLGFVFGAVVLLSGDAAPFLTINFWGTIATVLVKGTVAGMCAGLIYQLLEERNRYVAVISAAIICPIVNTGIFVMGCELFFMDTIEQWAQGTEGFVGSSLEYILFFMIGLNFLFEMLFNIVLSPVILRIIHIGKKAKV